MYFYKFMAVLAQQQKEIRPHLSRLSHRINTKYLTTLCCESRCGMDRLLHSPSLVAIGLSAGHVRHGLQLVGITPLWLVGLKIDGGLPSAPLHYGFTWPVGIPTVLQIPVTVPLHCPNDRQLPAVRAVQGDCERVYGMVECLGDTSPWDTPATWQPKALC